MKSLIVSLSLIVMCSCAHSEEPNKKKGHLIEKWSIIQDDGSEKEYQHIYWLDYSKKIKEKEIIFSGEYTTYKYFLENGFKKRVEIFNGDKLFSSTKYAYDQFDNLLSLTVVMDDDTSVVTYNNKLNDDGKLLESDLFSSGESGIVGRIRVEYSDSSKVLNSYIQDSLVKSESYFYLKSNILKKYELCELTQCKIIIYDYNSNGDYTLKSYFQDGKIYEKWIYSYSDSGRLKEVIKWKSGFENEVYIVDYK